MAGGTLSLVSPRSLEALLSGGRPARVAAGLEAMPYWAELWPASVALARWIMRGPCLDGRAAVDLGCGLGLAGVAAGVRGARVTFVDRDADALRFAAFNARQNAVAAFDVRRAAFGALGSVGPCDLVTLADVTYEDRLHAPLLRSLHELLAAGGRAVFADPGRETGDRFLARAAADFRIELTELVANHAGKRCAIRLAVLSRAAR